MDFTGQPWILDNKKALNSQGFLNNSGLRWIIIGGSAWESNPPETVLAPHTGFEVKIHKKSSFPTYMSSL